MKIKTLRLSPILALAMAGFAGSAMTGCNSIEHRNAVAASAAADADASYVKLDNTLTAAIARLRALLDNPGNPVDYADAVKAVQSSVRSDADTVASARTSLKSDGDKQVARMQEKASEINNPDLTKDFLARTEKLRGYYTDYDKASAALGDRLAAGDRALNDVVVATGSNPTADVVKLAKDSVDRALDAFKDARNDIPDARKALATLRDNQPAVAK